ISVFNDDVATLDVAEVTQSLTEGLAQVGTRRQVGRQVAYSSGRGGLLGPGGPRAEESTEEKGDAEGKPQPSHLDSGPSNSRRRRVRIGPTSLWSRPRSLTRRSAAGASNASSGPLKRLVRRTLLPTGRLMGQHTLLDHLVGALHEGLRN